MPDSVLSALPKLAAITTISLGLNYIITRLLKRKEQHSKRHKRSSTSRGSVSRTVSFNEILKDEQLNSQGLWGSLQLDDVGEDSLLQEL